MDEELALRLHKELRGKIEINSKMYINNLKDLSLIYTPYVASISKAIYNNKELVYEYTSKWNNIAIVTDGSRVLGLGDLGGEASLPVMEGKAMLFKQYGNINAYPICLSTKNKDEIISIIKNIIPSFGAINIEDIESPKCLEIVDALNDLPIPVFHDDQHGTAAVVLAALINAFKITNKSLDSKIVVVGVGSAGYGIINLLYEYGAKNIIALDSKGIINRYNRSDKYKKRIGEITNKDCIDGDLSTALRDAEIFIGVSGKGGLLNRDMISLMRDPIILAISNPDPEIIPDDAKRYGVKIVATGRSDYNNQVNNLLVFPFLMRVILDKKSKVDGKLLIRYALMLANSIDKIDYEHIIPNIIDAKAINKLKESIKS
jgi:malate dehydrogenase (oxaloacetate-decarboxylating)